MNYKFLRENILKQKNPANGVRVNYWQRMFLDFKTHEIYVVHKDWTNNNGKIWHEKNKAMFTIDQDNIMTTEHQLSVNVFANFGISGRFTNRVGTIVREIYVHNMFDRYESKQTINLDFRNGKPLNLLNIKNFYRDKVRQKEIDQELAQLRTQYLNLARLKGFILDRRFNEFPDWVRHPYEREKYLVNTLKHQADDWGTQFNLMVGQYHQWKGGGYDVNRVYDSLIRFHKSAIYRALGAIKSTEEP